MAGSEFFTVGLRDKVTGPSEKMGRAALKLERQLARLEKMRQVKLGTELGAQRLSLQSERLRRQRSSLFGGSSKQPFKVSGGELASFGRGAILTISGIAAAASVATVAVGVKLAGAFKTATDSALSSKLAFTAMLGSAQKAEDFQNRALTLASRYGMDVNDTFGAIRNSLSSGFDRKQSEGILALSADLRFLGASSEGVGRAMLALNQIKTAGVLQGDEIRQLSEVGGLDVEKVYTRIGERMGIVAKNGKSINQQVIKLKEAGKIDALTALNSIAEVISGKTKMGLGEAGALAASNTLEGLGGKLLAKAQTLLFEVGREAGPNLVKGIAAIVGADTGTTDVKLFLGLSGFVNDLGAFLEKVGPKIPSIAENFTKAFGAASGLGDLNLSNFADRLPQIATQLGTIAGNLVSITTSVAKLLSSNGVMGAVVTTADVLSGNLPNKFANSQAQKDREKRGFFGTVWDGIVDPNGKRSGAALTDGVAKGISSSNSAEKAATGLAKGVSAATDKELKIHSPSKVGNEKGQLWDQGMAQGIVEHDLSGLAARDGARGVAQSAHRALMRPSMSFSAETEAAADALSRGRSSGVSLSVGDVNITVDGKGSTAKETAQETFQVFEDQIGAMLDRLCQGAGA